MWSDKHGGSLTLFQITHHLTFLLQVGDCQWTRDGFALGTDKTLPELPRYRMETCDLVIDPVLPLDEGLYQCQVGGARGVAPVASEVAGISVNCEPGRPYIVQAREGEELEVGAGEEVELHCQSQGGKPPAEIQWWDTDTGSRMVADMSGEWVIMLHMLPRKIEKI